MRTRHNYYRDLRADYSRAIPVEKGLGDELIAMAKNFGQRKAEKLPSFDVNDPTERERIEGENREWWPTHCEALRRGDGGILSDEYREDPPLVYLCQDGPFFGRSAGTRTEASWWKILSQPGVTMSWPIVMFFGEVVYFEWRCADNETNETTAKGNVTFLRRGHSGGVYLKTEQLTFYRDVTEDFFCSEASG